MGFFWFVVGVISGLALAWYYLNKQFESRLAERDREIDHNGRKWHKNPVFTGRKKSPGSGALRTCPGCPQNGDF